MRGTRARKVAVMASKRKTTHKSHFPKRHPGGHGDCLAKPELWRVVDRHCNYSAFNGHRYTPSDYSFCKCTKCGHGWRTKADYVALLADASASERMK